MLPKTKRLSTAEVSKIMEKGKVHHSSLFSVRTLEMQGPSRMSAIVPNKISKLATKRNKLRRQIYETIRVIYPSIKSNTLIIVLAKPNALESKHNVIAQDIHGLFVKAGIMR